MPGLNLVELRQLNRVPPYLCPDCRYPVRKNYCRECDEFFEAGHSAPVCRDAHGTVKHEKHRSY